MLGGSIDQDVTHALYMGPHSDLTAQDAADFGLGTLVYCTDGIIARVKKYKESEDREFIQTTKNLYILIIFINYRSLTSFNINWVDNMNSAYIYANRICRNLSTRGYYFFSNGSSNHYFNKQPRSCILFNILFHSSFPLGNSYS